MLEAGVGWGWEQNVKRSWCKGLQGADLGKVWLLPCVVGAWWFCTERS